MSEEAPLAARSVPGMRAVAAELAGPVYTFVPQPQVEAFAATAGRASGRVVKMCLSYSYFRFPARREDPRNFVDLTEQQRAAIARAEASSLPVELREQIGRARFPILFEAVRTSLPIPSERAHPLESRLEAHIVDVLRAMFPGQPRPERSHRARARPLRNYTVQRGVPLLVDDEMCRSYRVEIAPHVIAVGAQVQGRYFTAVVPTVVFPNITLAFVTLAPDRAGRRAEAMPRIAAQV